MKDSKKNVSVSIYDDTELSDIEAQISVRTKYPSASRRQSDNLTSSFNLPMLIYVAVVLVTICAMLVPLFVEVTRIQTISSSDFR